MNFQHPCLNVKYPKRLMGAGGNEEYNKCLLSKNLGLNRLYHGLHSLRDHLDSLTTKTHAVD